MFLVFRIKVLVRRNSDTFGFVSFVITMTDRIEECD